jgi:hypothetical protein
MLLVEGRGRAMRMGVGGCRCMQYGSNVRFEHGTEGDSKLGRLAVDYRHHVVVVLKLRSISRSRVTIVLTGVTRRKSRLVERRRCR